MNNFPRSIFNAACCAALLLISASAAADYRDHPKAKAFAAKMQSEHGFTQQEMDKILQAAEKKQTILDAISKPAEKTKEWFEYRKIFIQDSRIEQGVEFWQNNAATLKRAAETFGVDPEIIVAIIGVETRYGRHTGTHRVIDALTTLGFDYAPRSTFFSRELEEFLLLAREQKQDALALTGSYAGAMGYGQFIPSSYRAYAVDFDNDKLVDIWQNPVDAIGSVANYFKVHKWRLADPVLAPATAKKNADSSILNSKAAPDLSLAALKNVGYTPSSGDFDAKRTATPLRVIGDTGEEYYLGFHNFYVITRYNRSHLYAMAVNELSQAIKDAYQQVQTTQPVKKAI